MSLDTYLPTGKGSYISGSLRESDGRLDSFYYFIPDNKAHVKVGFLVIGSGDYQHSGYMDVVVFNPDLNRIEFTEAGSGEYEISRRYRFNRIVELRSNDKTQKYVVFEQPKLGRFRFLMLNDHEEEMEQEIIAHKDGQPWADALM